MKLTNRRPVRLLTVLLSILFFALSGCSETDKVEKTSDTADSSTSTQENTPTKTTGQTTDNSTTETGKPDKKMSVRVYFTMSENETHYLPGPFLVSVHRRVPATLGVAKAAITALLEGPTARETAKGMGSNIPDDTRLHGISIEDGIATIDFSASFESGGGSLSMFARLAAVVYTATQFPTVDKVQFELDGKPITVFSGEGILLEEPVGREDYHDILPPVFLDTPAWGAPAHNPVRVTGISNVFEGTVQITLVAADGTELAHTFTTATCGTGCWGTFKKTIPYKVAKKQKGTLTVWEESAKDGSKINVRSHPVLLAPAK